MRLLEDFDEPLTPVQLVLRSLIEIGTELREGGKFAVLGKIETERTGDRSHGLELRAAADAAYGKAHVDGGPDVGAGTQTSASEIGSDHR